MARPPRTAALLLALLTPLAFAPTAARAQDPAATPTATGPGPLLAFTLDEAPMAPSFVRLLRITLEPGAAVPTHTHPGPELNRVEAGTLTVLAEGDALLTRAPDADRAADGAAAVPEPAPVGEVFELTPGDQVAFPRETAFGFRNDGDERVSLLTAVVLPAGSQRPPGIAYPEGSPAADAYAGVANTVLGDGVATRFPTGPVAIAVERLRLAAGEPLPASPDPTLVSLAAGELAFAVRAGRVQVSRTATPGPQNETPVGAEVELAPGDAAFFPDGLAEAARPGPGEVELLVLAVRPAESSPATPPATPGAAAPAEIAIAESAAVLPTPTPAPGAPTQEVPAPATEETEAPTEPAAPEDPTEAPDEPAEVPTAAPEGTFAVGTVVEVVETEVRLRAGPSTDDEIVSGVDQGAPFEVTGDPVEGSGILWYPVRSVNDPTLEGWIAADFLAPAEDEDEE